MLAIVRGWTLLILEVRGQRSRSQLTCMEISLWTHFRLNHVCFFIELGRHVNHGEAINSIDFGGHRSKLKVRMGIIDKCQMRGDATLCVNIFKIHVLCCLFFITEWRMEHEKQIYQKSTNIYRKMSRSLQYMRKKWSEMLCVHCIEKPVGLFAQWFCMNICISFIGDCKSNCSRDMLKIYI